MAEPLPRTRTGAYMHASAQPISISIVLHSKLWSLGRSLLHNTPMAQSTAVLHFSGHQWLRNRLVLSIISGKPVKVDKIRPDDKNPGLRGEHKEVWLEGPF